MKKRFSTITFDYFPTCNCIAYTLASVAGHYSTCLEWKDLGSNPGAAICLEYVCYRINFPSGQPVYVESAVEHQQTKQPTA